MIRALCGRRIRTLRTPRTLRTVDATPPDQHRERGSADAKDRSLQLTDVDARERGRRKSEVEDPMSSPRRSLAFPNRVLPFARAFLVPAQPLGVFRAERQRNREGNVAPRLGRLEFRHAHNEQRREPRGGHARNAGDERREVLLARRRRPRVTIMRSLNTVIISAAGLARSARVFVRGRLCFGSDMSSAALGGNA